MARKPYSYPHNKIAFRGEEKILLKLDQEAERQKKPRSQVIRTALIQYFDSLKDDPSVAA